MAPFEYLLIMLPAGSGLVGVTILGVPADAFARQRAAVLIVLALILVHGAITPGPHCACYQSRSTSALRLTG